MNQAPTSYLANITYDCIFVSLITGRHKVCPYIWLWTYYFL